MRRTGYKNIIFACLSAAALWTGTATAVPELVKSCVVLLPEAADPDEEQELLLLVRGAGEELVPEETSVIFGETRGEITGYGKAADLESAYRTILMVDTSLSMILSDPGNEAGVKAFASAFADQHIPGERFELYTFGRELEPLAEGTDPEEIKRRIGEAAFENKESYLLKALKEVIEKILEDPEDTGSWTRIVLITDGADDNPEPPSHGDITKLLGEARDRVPVYAGLCIWDKDRSGIRELTSLAAASGGRAFMLPELSPEQIPEAVREVNGTDHDMDYFTAAVPAEEKDGSPKEMQLTLSLTGGRTCTLSRIVPGMTCGDRETEEALFAGGAGQERETEGTAETREKAREALTEGMQDTPAEGAREVRKEKMQAAGTDMIPEASEMISEASDMIPETSDMIPETSDMIPETSDMVREVPGDGKQQGPVRFLIAGGLLLMAVNGLLLFFFLQRRKSRREDPGQAHSAGAPGTGSCSRGGSSEETPRHPGTLRQLRKGGAAGVRDEKAEGTAAWDEKDETVCMWDSGAPDETGITVSLSDLRNPGEQYTFHVGAQTIVGRGSGCGVMIGSDGSISGEHLRLMVYQGELVAEDLGSTNGTFINGMRVVMLQKLRDGDVLGLGNKKLRVRIRS